MDLTTFSPLVNFSLLLGALLLWLLVPLIPAIMELVRPRDAAPLNAVGNDAGLLTFFADSFTQRATQEGLMGTMVPPRLSDGTLVRSHSQGEPITASRKPITDVVVLMDGEPLPENAVLERECLARLSVHGSTGVTYRALLGLRDVLLGRNSTILRWVHARGRLEVDEGTQLLGRATADRSITLATNVTFSRLEAAIIRVSGEEAVDMPVLPDAAYQRFVPEKSVSMGPSYWRVTGDLVIPAGAVLVGSLIATGSIIVREGARVTGSMKAHREIRIQAGAVVAGSCAARGRVVIESGSRVSGPIISESEIRIDSAIVGSAGRMTTVTSPSVRLTPGATVYGAIMAAESGFTVASA